MVVLQYSNVLEVYYGDRLIETMPRLRGDKDVRVDYRHVIWSLVRQPGAFARYRFREELFSSLTFRLADDALSSFPGLWVVLRPPFDRRGCLLTITPTDQRDFGDRITLLLRGFKLPTAASELANRLIAAGCPEALEVVHEVFEMERQDRWDRKVARLRYESKLPPGKTFETFDLTRLPRPLAAKLNDLARGEFAERAINVLAFGLPGTGKSHGAAALGHALVERGPSVLWVPTFKLVQDLLVAKRELALPRALRKLDSFEVMILDDIGYVQQAPEEVEVLFTLLAERYEKRSMIITSNLVFSQWDRVFKNPMTTAAAIDRLVHHCAILEFDVPSYRSMKESARQGEPEPMAGSAAGNGQGKARP